MCRIAVANNASDSVTLLHGTPTGAFVDGGTCGKTLAPSAVTAGDLNGDGQLDLVVANSLVVDGGSTVSVLVNKGNGTFATRVLYPVSAGPRAIAAVDLNGDGKLDLAVANAESNSVSVLLGDGDAGFAAPVDHATGLKPTSIAAADLNGDGRPDLVITNSGDDTLTILLTTCSP